MSDEDLSGLPSLPMVEGESNSLEEHEASYGPNGTGEPPELSDEPPGPAAATADPLPDPAERDDKGRFQKTPRHRAKSQQASPDDVPRIRDLTAKLRAAEAERDALKQRSSQAPTAPAALPQGIAPAQVPPVGPERGDSGQSRPPAQPWTPPATRPKPTEDEIGDKYKTYADFTEDLSDWVGEQREARREARQQQEQRQTTYQEWGSSYQQQLAEAKTRYPDYDQAIATIDAQLASQRVAIPQVILDAIVSSKKGPDVAYYLATHPEEYQELIRDAWPVNAFASIGMVRRVLESRLPVASPQRSGLSAAASTGSAPRSPSLVPAPRPPNPVRTGPQKIGDDPPGEDDSLEAHEQFHYKRGR